MLDLNPATWYNLRVTAHNNAGFSVAEYEFATLTVTGGELTRKFIFDYFKLFILSYVLVTYYFWLFILKSSFATGCLQKLCTGCPTFQRNSKTSVKSCCNCRTTISTVLLLFAGTLAPAREIPNGGEDNDGSAGNIEDTIMYIMTNVNLIVPVVSAIAVIVIAIVVICVLRGRDNRGFPKGNAFVLSRYNRAALWNQHQQE